MSIMQGFPPAEADRATLANWRKPPHCAWAFHHVREIVPSAEIANEPGDVWALEPGELDLSSVNLEAEMAKFNNDALVILHTGRLVHESYRNGMGPRDPHILMSVSKSVLGLVAGTAVEAGELDPAAPITDYVPEVAETVFKGATVRDALDMRVGVKFEEDYFATDGPIIDYRYAANWNPAPDGKDPGDLRSFHRLLTEPDGGHGERFHYVSPNTDLLGWVLERATGVRYADLVSERLWKPLGAEAPAYITVDRIGGARAAGGMCMTARDLARVGRLVAEGGMRDGRRIIPESWLADIAENGDRKAWAEGDFFEDFGKQEMSYRSKWYVHPDGLIHGLGIHGQYLFVDPARELVVAWFSSEGDPINTAWLAAGMETMEKIRKAAS